MNGILWALLLNLLLTLAVELGVAAIAGVRGSDLAQGAVPYICLAALEVGVVAVEALLFKKLLRYRKIKPLLLSLLLNGASFAAGELVGLVISFI